MSAQAAEGISEEGPYTVFRTGTGQPLLTLELPLDIPNAERVPILTLNLGFSSAESPGVPGLFHDSFSLTLQNTTRTATALLLTADSYGTAWAPVAQGGLTIDPGDLEYSSQVFAPINPAFEIRYAYSVSYRLPPELTSGAATLYLDLFDNGNDAPSVAYVSNVQITALPDTNRPPTFVVLQSSASAAGPFADESGAKWNPADRTVVWPRMGGARFYKLQADVRVRIGPPVWDGDWVRFRYAYDPTVLVFESADRPEGPYTAEPSAVIDRLEQAASLSLPDQPRFYRVRSDVGARLTRLQTVEDRLWLSFEYDVRPAGIALLSSAALGGPYAVESGFALDPQPRWLTGPREGGARFFRLRSDVGVRIIRIRMEAEQCVFDYQ